ncbi:MAG TPA: FdhF/YdeP family oxidoreductase [Terriglobales bacterium]|nr:FdhF/YdeP family oxidoreductase [Terriglobales bacterium]
MPAILQTLNVIREETGLIRGIKALRHLNQKDGFDCPGCAWPDPDGERTANEYCENGAKAVAEEATSRRVTPEFFARWSVSGLTQQSDLWLGKQGRLTHPMLLREGSEHYEPLSWEHAFQLIARELNALSSPDEAVFYTSGRTSNEAAFLYQLFVRRFGTNNLPDCSNMCHESSGSALTPVIGVGKGTVTLRDFELADAIFVVGQNPGTNHPRMLTYLQAAARRGCSIVSINPLPEVALARFKHPQHPLEWLGSGTPIAKLFLQVRINGDLALFKGLIKELLEEEARRPGEVLDKTFVAERTSGFRAFSEAAATASWDQIVAQSGISREQIRQAAEVVIKAKSIICCWAMGLTQHKNAVATIQEIVNFMLLRGNIGRPGAGVCPVRGHSNVQGDRTMGIYEKPSPQFLERLGREFSFEPPPRHGFDTVDAIRAMHNGNAKVFFAVGGNFLSATPDTDFTAAALRRCRLTVHVSTKLNRAHLVTGKQALILPCLGRTESDLQSSGEQFVSVEDSMGIVHASRGRLAPASEHLRSEPAIVAGLAQAVLGNKSSVDWAALASDYDLIRARIERVIPGFEDYNQRVRQAGGFYLPNSARDGVFNTSDGRAHFTVHPLTGVALQPGQFLLTTIRSHDQYNTTIYGLDDRYRGVSHGRRVIFLNQEDMRERGWRTGDLLDITSHFQGEQRVARRFAAAPYNIPRRNAAAYFPEANVLVPIGSAAEVSNTPTSKSIVITLEPARS